MSEKIIGFPCPYMRNSGNNYVTCDIRTALWRLKSHKWSSCENILCAWFYDIGDDGINNVTKKDVVPRRCPKKYTFERIDAKIQLVLIKQKREPNDPLPWP